MPTLHLDMGNTETVDAKSRISEDEKQYAVSIIPRGELAGTSRLQPGTTLRRMGEFIPMITLKERLIAFYAKHKADKDNIPHVAATWEGKDIVQLNEGLRKQYGATLEAFPTGMAVNVTFEQFWEQKGDFTHTSWTMDFPPSSTVPATDPISTVQHTIKLIHAGITGGACTAFLDGAELGSGQMGDISVSNNMLLPKALYDGGCSFKFPLRSRIFRVEVRLCGSILEEQHYTYHLYMDDRPALPSGAPGTLPARFQDAVNLMKALQPRYELRPEEKLHLYSLYMQATEGDCNLDKPNLVDVAGQEQWNAWNALKGTNKAESMKAYCIAAMKQATENSIHPLVPVITKESLIFFFHQHNRSALARVDDLLTNYSTEQLMAALKEKYLETPVLTPTLSSPCKPTTDTPEACSAMAAAPRQPPTVVSTTPQPTATDISV